MVGRAQACTSSELGGWSHSLGCTNSTNAPRAHERVGRARVTRSVADSQRCVCGASGARAWRECSRQARVLCVITQQRKRPSVSASVRLLGRRRHRQRRQRLHDRRDDEPDDELRREAGVSACTRWRPTREASRWRPTREASKRMCMCGLRTTMHVKKPMPPETYSRVSGSASTTVRPSTASTAAARRRHGERSSPRRKHTLWYARAQARREPSPRRAGTHSRGRGTERRWASPGSPRKRRRT